MLKKYFILLVLVCRCAAAQQVVFNVPDSLKDKDFGYFEKRISMAPADSTKSFCYACSWLAKARSENNDRQLSYAYKAMIYHSAKALHLKYADSSIIAARRTGDNALIGAAYLTKGTLYYGYKQHTQALDNFLTADSYVSRTQDAYLYHKVKFTIAQTKYYLGFYDEAIALLKECVDYFADENDRAYLNSLHSLGLCYNRVGKYELCADINRQGIAAGIELSNLEMQPYFIHSNGVNEYFRNHYDESIRLLSEILPVLHERKDFANEAVANFYLGKSSQALHRDKLALDYFKKVDGAFQKENYIRPDLREGYEILIDYYKTHGDKEMQLLYINRLLKVDSILHQNYRYLSSKIFRQYDTKKLLNSKAAIERSMETRKNIDYTIIALLSVLVVFLVFRHFANKRLHRRKYEELMNRKPEAIAISNPEKDAEFDLNPELVKTLLKNLDKFEAGKKYLEKDMNLLRMAELLHTNTKYVTKIIHRYRNKGTIEYISDLKIDHIVELLKTENRYRNYTNKALGEEAGFGSTQNFTRAFKARNVISPTYFIQELKKDLRE